MAINRDNWDNPAPNVANLPLRLRPARMPDPQTIPPRPWLYGTILQRGYVTVLVAPGGTGKTQAAMAIAMAMARGETILGHHVHFQTNTWILNLEDPLDEMDRRLAALMIHHGVTRESLTGSLFMHSGRDRRICMGVRDPDGQLIVFPDREAIVEATANMNIGLIVVDPYVKSHSLNENSNEDMDAAATAWAEIADEIRCAILLVHHVRKGPVLDIDSARGATALIAASRAAYMLQTMSEQEAEELSIPKKERWRHIRMDDGKANMAPPAAVADWFRMEMVALHNRTPEYPHGDMVAALARWEPPSVWESQSSAEINTCLDEIDNGHPRGGLYQQQKRGKKTDRWVGVVLINRLPVNEAQATLMVSAWMKSGVLVEATYQDPDQRREKTGLRVNDAHRPT